MKRAARLSKVVMLAIALVGGGYFLRAQTGPAPHAGIVAMPGGNVQFVPNAIQREFAPGVEERIVQISDCTPEACGHRLRQARLDAIVPEVLDRSTSRMVENLDNDDDSEPSSSTSPYTGRATEILLQAASAYETKLAVIANNLGNADTFGYKSARVLLESCSYHQQKLPGTQDVQGNYTPTGIAVGLGTRVQSTQTDFGQGAFRTTNRPLDVAVDGRGFFQVTDPDSGLILYTRAGNFSINAVGQLVIGSAQTGRVVSPAISFPPDATGIVISSNGTVQFMPPNSPNLNNAGQLQLVQFINPEGLSKLGENLFRQTDSSGPPQVGTPGQNGLGTVQQGRLEDSNVDVRAELRAWSATRQRLAVIEKLLDEMQ